MMACYCTTSPRPHPRPCPCHCPLRMCNLNSSDLQEQVFIIGVVNDESLEVHRVIRRTTHMSQHNKSQHNTTRHATPPHHNTTQHTTTQHNTPSHPTQHTTTLTQSIAVRGDQGKLCRRSAQSISIIYECLVAASVLEVIREGFGMRLVVFKLQEKEGKEMKGLDGIKMDKIV